MYLVGIAAPKGGVGKSTLAWNLAWYWHINKLSVCIVDLDPQQTLMDLAIEHKDSVPFPVFPVLTAVPKTGFDVCIVDHPPTSTGVVYGDVVVAPMKAHDFDKKSFLRAQPKFANVHLVPVVNLLKLNNKEQMSIAQEMKREHKAIWIKDRSVFELSTKLGCFVGDVKASRVRYQAADEISLIAQKVELCLTA